jgi:phosphorylcholine metabolism protein LicD
MDQQKIQFNEKKIVFSLQQIKSFLDEENVKYWLNFGTLLGAVRDKKIISWDNDIDLSVSVSEVNKVLKIIPKMSELGWRVDVTDPAIYFSKNKETLPIGISIYRFCGDKAWVFWINKDPRFYAITKYFYRIADKIKYRKYHRKIPFLEKFLYSLIPSSFHSLARKVFFKISYFFGKKDTILLFPRKMIDNLDQIEFYNMKFNIPSLVDEYLSLAYDKNWRKSNPFWTYEKATGINYDFFNHNNRHKYPLF